MKFINFPESNLPLAAGGNENTQAMRVCVCEHPDYKPGTIHFASKWEFDDEEKYRIREAVKAKLSHILSPEPTDEVLNAVINSLPNIWLTVMHTPPPVMITMMPPFYYGYKKMQLNRPIDN